MKPWLLGLMLPFLLLEPLAADSGEIAQRDILNRVGDHELVRQARLSLALREESLAAVTGWLGIQAGLTPSIRYDDKTGAIALAETGIRADLMLPLGSASADREKRIAARELAEIARLELEESFGKAFTDLFRLYSSAYTAQEFRALAAREVSYYRLRLDSVNLRATRGLAAVSDQADAEAEYQAAVEQAIQAGMDARIAWFNLAYASGQEVARPGPASAGQPVNPEAAVLDLPKFQAPDLGFMAKDLPQPGLLMSSSRSPAAAILYQNQKLAVARRNLEKYSGSNLNVAPRFLYATPAASASVGYGTANGAISLGLDWLPYVNPDAVTGNSTPPDNSFSVTILVSGSLNPNASSERGELEAIVRLEESKLAALEQGIDLIVRSRYTAYLRARDSLAEAERSARLAREVAAVNRARQALGQLTPEDEAANELLTARTVYSVAKARAALGLAYLDAVSATNAWDLAGIEFEGAKP